MRMNNFWLVFSLTILVGVYCKSSKKDGVAAEEEELAAEETLAAVVEAVEEMQSEQQMVEEKPTNEFVGKDGQVYFDNYDHDDHCDCKDKDTNGDFERTYPHIVFIHVDDLGYNDIGFNNEEIQTPNIDRLAENGVILSNTYVPPICSPSRSAFITGMQPYKSQMQHGNLVPVNPHCVPTNVPFLSEYLMRAQYRSHVFGKWHLGFCKLECTPTFRGFESFNGCYGGVNNHYTHDTMGSYDWRDNTLVDTEASDAYSTFYIKDKAKSLIKDYKDPEPLFLWLSFPAPARPISAPEEDLEKMYEDEEEPRRTYLTMISNIDTAVGEIVETLQKAGLWDDTFLVFTSDNGGEAGGYASNYPYRGGKGSLFEGGTKVPTVVSSTLLTKWNYTNDGLFHTVDWVPTLLGVAGISDCDDDLFDGYDQSDMILHGTPSVRKSFIYNIDIEESALYGNAAIRVGNYKLIWGHPGYSDGHGLQSKPIFHMEEYLRLINKTEADYTDIPDERMSPNWLSEQEKANQEAIVQTIGIAGITLNDKDRGMVQLFNLATDPSEEEDLSNDPAFGSLIDDLKSRILYALETEYLTPHEDASEYWLAESSPEGEGRDGAWGPGWCDQVTIEIPREANLETDDVEDDAANVEGFVEVEDVADVQHVNGVDDVDGAADVDYEMGQVQEENTNTTSEPDKILTVSR